eukprot:RCo005213
MPFSLGRPSLGRVSRVAPRQEIPLAAPFSAKSPSLTTVGAAASQAPVKAAIVHIPVSPVGGLPARLVRVSALEVTFAAQPVVQHLGRPLLVVLRLAGSRRKTAKALPEHEKELVTARWGEGWVFEVPARQDFEDSAVLEMDLQAVGLLRNTTLASMNIDLTKLPMSGYLQHSVGFEFGMMSVQLQFKLAPTSQSQSQLQS